MTAGDAAGSAPAADPVYRHHHEAIADLPAAADDVFAFLDDPQRLAAHMASRSPMMAGAAMKVELDAQRGQAVGSRIRLAGRVLGVSLSVDEAITERVPPQRKVWQTLGEPRLLVIGRYRMGFDLQPLAGSTRVRLWIDHDPPSRGPAHTLGRLLGGWYARWCVDQMLRGCRERFAGALTFP